MLRYCVWCPVDSLPLWSGNLPYNWSHRKRNSEISIVSSIWAWENSHTCSRNWPKFIVDARSSIHWCDLLERSCRNWAREQLDIGYRNIILENLTQRILWMISLTTTVVGVQYTYPWLYNAPTYWEYTVRMRSIVIHSPNPIMKKGIHITDT